MYLMLRQGNNCPQFSALCKIYVPLKIKIFLWQLARGRLPLLKRRGQSQEAGTLCGEFEDVDHLFFTFYPAKYLWSYARSLLQVE
jgi:hypothetical protein